MTITTNPTTVIVGEIVRGKERDRIIPHTSEITATIAVVSRFVSEAMSIARRVTCVAGSGVVAVAVAVLAVVSREVKATAQLTEDLEWTSMQSYSVSSLRLLISSSFLRLITCLCLTLLTLRSLKLDIEEELKNFERKFYEAEEGGAANDESANPFLGDEEKVKKFEEDVEKTKRNLLERRNPKQSQLTKV
jgi:hypothetical protein